MARTIKEIYDEIIRSKENESALSELTSNSKVAIWKLWAHVVASSIWVLETLFDMHKSEVYNALKELKPHTTRWYRNKALNFQYGFDLIENSDKFNNDGASEDQIEESKIVKYSAVEESQSESRLIIKIAGEEHGKLQPLKREQEDSFNAYIHEIKDAGVRVSILNSRPDILSLNMDVYIDPLVIDSNGTSILTGKKPIEDALKEFMKELPFNGELILQNLVDKLQVIEGIKIIDIIKAESKWLDPETNGYGDYIPIRAKTIPFSGYFEIENFNNIKYIP